MAKYRKKPVVIEAVQWRGHCLFDVKELIKELNVDIVPVINGYSQIVIETLEGQMVADTGDWVIKGVKNEVYPCNPDIFEQTYEKVED